MKLTPASAGNTQGPSANSALPRVHPRLREEHERSCTLVPAPIGLPPLTQGMQDHLRHRKNHVRITPALQGASPIPHSKKTLPKIPSNLSIPSSISRPNPFKFSQSSSNLTVPALSSTTHRKSNNRQKSSTVTPTQKVAETL